MRQQAWPLPIEVRVAFDNFSSFAAMGMALEALARLCWERRVHVSLKVFFSQVVELGFRILAFQVSLG